MAGTTDLILRLLSEMRLEMSARPGELAGRLDRVDQRRASIEALGRKFAALEAMK